MSDYVRNLWYMAAWVGEVPEDGVLARTFLDEKWLIYRLTTGGYAMLRDRCAHRFVQLSKGERHGDVIHCPYHGLGFAAAGACVHSPFPDVHPQASVATMPIVARHDALWFWPGEAALADEGTIPDFAYLSDPDRAAWRGYLPIKGHYELMTDNLMDLTHAEFLHRESFGVNGSIFTGKQTVRQDDDGAIWNNWDMVDSTPPDWAKPMLNEGERVDQYLHMRWHAPSCMDLSIGMARAGSGGADFVVPSMRNPHIITPETQETCHYFYDHAPGEEEAARARQVFVMEDEPMIAAAHEGLNGQDFWDARPLILPSDAGAIRARRRLMQLRNVER